MLLVPANTTKPQEMLMQAISNIASSELSKLLIFCHFEKMQIQNIFDPSVLGCRELSKDVK